MVPAFLRLTFSPALPGPALIRSGGSLGLLPNEFNMLNIFGLARGLPCFFP